jgi:hypothetical protein
MSRQLSTLRLNSMRFLYLFTAVVVGISAWPAVINPGKPWDTLQGVAWSFYAAYSLLMLLGVRFPVEMLPLMLLQLFYKLIWLIGVGYPLWSAGHLAPMASGALKSFTIAAVLDLIVIPWPYVFENYVEAIFKLGAKYESLSKEQATAAGERRS